MWVCQCRANEKAPEKPHDDFLAPRPTKAARRSVPATALGTSALSAAHARCLAVLSAAAHADPCAALGALQHAFEWLDDREERGAAPGGVGFVPKVDWVVGLGSAAAVCGECGAGAAAWRLVTDLVYHDSFGLMKWSPGSLQVCVLRMLRMLCAGTVAREGIRGRIARTLKLLALPRLTESIAGAPHMYATRLGLRNFRGAICANWSWKIRFGR